MARVTREWLDDHGYQHIRCSKCGWSGWTDTGVCEGCAEEKDEEQDYCEACGERMEKDSTGEIRCPNCEYGGVHSNTVTEKATTHVAHKNHGPQIKIGDTYKRIVRMGHYADGPRWMEVVKVRVRKSA